MRSLRYVTHPNVAIDAAVPVPEWGLNDEGRRRATAMLQQPWIATTNRIVSSTETKSVETAQLIAGHVGRAVEVRDGIGENDRSATGFVPPERFERLADAFFAEPEASVEGWERAVDAQARIAAGLEDLLTPHGEDDGDIVVVGHGGVGTLWFCHLAGLPIDRRHDQPGQGHYFTVDLSTGGPLHPWRPIDEMVR